MAWTRKHRRDRTLDSVPRTSDRRHPAQLVTAAVAGIEGLLLLGYGVSIAVVALTSGLSGPGEVSSPAGTAVEVAVFAAFGIGLGAVAWGRWRDRDWSVVPFVLAQLLALVAAVPMATGQGAGVPVGIVVTALALAGLASLVVLRISAPDPANK